MREKPKPSSRAQSTMAAANAPECEIKPIPPCDGMGGWRKVVSSGKCVSMVPIQLGPNKRTPCCFATSTHCCSSFAPSSPTSRKPAETITAALMPRFPQSSMAPAVALVGTMSMASSTGSGISCKLVWICLPNISPLFCATRWTAPLYPLWMRLRATP